MSRKTESKASDDKPRERPIIRITSLPDFHPEILIFSNPDVHPEDAEKAVVAKLKQAVKGRKETTKQEVLVDFFIATLANSRPWNEKQVRQIAELSASKDFCERFARALEHGRARIFDKVDGFILCNWRKWANADRVENIGELPGLQDWNPTAACEFMVFVGLHEAAKGSTWYSTRRKRLGLPGKNRHRYLIKEWHPLPDGTVKIVV